VANAVPRIALLSYCLDGDICADDNGVCSDGLCVCRSGYHINEARCGTLITIVIVGIIVNNIFNVCKQEGLQGTDPFENELTSPHEAPHSSGKKRLKASKRLKGTERSP